MNKVVIIGRLTRDPEVRYSNNANEPLCIARYTLAVDRRFKQSEEGPSADFIPCIAFGKQGEFAEKYLKMGTKIAIEGRIQTGSYEKDGVKHYTTDIVVERIEFCERKTEKDEDTQEPPKDLGSEFVNVDASNTDLPFK